MTRRQEVGKKLGEVSIREISTYYFYYYFLYFLPTHSLSPLFSACFCVYETLGVQEVQEVVLGSYDVHTGRLSERRMSWDQPVLIVLFSNTIGRMPKASSPKLTGTEEVDWGNAVDIRPVMASLFAVLMTRMTMRNPATESGLASSSASGVGSSCGVKRGLNGRNLPRCASVAIGRRW